MCQPQSSEAERGNPSESTLDQPKPYHQMSIEEYAPTDHSQTVPRWSILNIPPETYTRAELCEFGKENLLALAFLWGVKHDGSKEELADRVIRRVQFRIMLARETVASLAMRSRKDLSGIAQEAGVYHPWLNRKDLAACLMQWLHDTRRHARMRLAEANHERIVRRAARKGLSVPADNLSRYGLDAKGDGEPTLVGVPLSRALRLAPEIIDAARRLSLPAFRKWVKDNPNLSDKVMFLVAGILADGGDCFWRGVQRAFKPPDLPPLFTAVATGPFTGLIS